MALTPGTKMGPYEITGAIGAGGMGEVYRAKDTRLGRDVAVKILPSHLSQNPEVRERFERESRAISSLNHPHICTLFDVGREGDADYFVMELLDGESLGARLERGPLKLDEALKIGTQVADGLSAAHKQGIVHRDLKPGNIVLTKSGAKILDFGVAKLRDEQVVEMATRTTPLTSHGAMVGTVQFMSPEQLEGKPVDQRADIFAFGALLYEMLTGQRAFGGQSQASVIAAILTSEPRPVSELLPVAPPALDRVVRQCLAKDPDERWSSAGDLARELKWIADGKSPSVVASAPVAKRSMRESIAWALAAIGILIGIAGAYSAKHAGPEHPAAPVTRFTVLPTDGQVDGSPIVSPDGRLIVFGFIPGTGSPALWLHSMETGKAKAIPGTEGGRLPFWSPDGKAIGFFSQGRLRRVSLGGEPPQALCDAADPRGGSWGTNGDILFTRTAAAGLFRIASSGGVVTALTEPDTKKGEQSHRFPEFLPDGTHFLYTATGVASATGVFWASLAGGEGRRVLSDSTMVKYDRAGFLVFKRSGALMAQLFDPAKGTLAGEPALLGADVGTDAQITALDQFSVSSNGVLALRTGASQRLQMTWFDREGKQLGRFGEGYRLYEPILSPDGTKIAVGGSVEGSTDNAIWVIDLNSGNQVARLTFGDGDEETPVWSPDGRFLYFTANDEKGRVVKRKAISGEGREEEIVRSESALWVNSATPDGRFLVCEKYESEVGSDLWLIPLTGTDHTLKPFRSTKWNESHSMFSPDGHYLAYVSDEAGIPEIFVETMPPSGSRWQVSNGGGDQPFWSQDGRALYYASTSRDLMRVEIKSLAPFTIGASTSLFKLAVPTFASTGPRSHFVVMPGEKRIAVNALVGEVGSRGFDVILNWDGVAPRK